MEVQLPLMVQDPSTARNNRIKNVETFHAYRYKDKSVFGAYACFTTTSSGPDCFASRSG
jgi:hypothetical protein